MAYLSGYGVAALVRIFRAAIKYLKRLTDDRETNGHE